MGRYYDLLACELFIYLGFNGIFSKDGFTIQDHICTSCMQLLSCEQRACRAHWLYCALEVNFRSEFARTQHRFLAVISYQRVVVILVVMND